MQVSEQLIAAKAMIDKPEKWVQGVYGRIDGATGKYCRLCSWAALIEAGNRTAISEQTFIAANKLGNVSLIGFNDTDGRTHAEVMIAFDNAIKLAQSRELSALQR